MDLLADALNAIQFRGTVYCHTDFRAPWGVHWEGRPGRSGFFMVTKGHCYIDSTVLETSVALQQGDFVMSPRSHPYTLLNPPNSKVVRFDDVIGGAASLTNQPVVRHGGSGDHTKLIMGCFELEASGRNPFLVSLPDFIFVKARDLQSEPWLETTLRFLAHECDGEKLGSSMAVSRLTELVFVQAIRVYVSQQEAHRHQSSWLRAAADPEIGRAMAMMHEQMAEAWTLARLADAVGMSRSAFADKFRRLADNTPLDYLTSWRMYRAQKMLAEGNTSLSKIAELVGYQSEAAFSKAFKRRLGCAPGVFKRQSGVGRK